MPGLGLASGDARGQIGTMIGTAIICGAGLGGLTAALALARRGWSVTVLERSEAFGEVGAGIQQSPNAMRVHRALGTADALEAVGFAPDAATIRDGRNGKALVRLPVQKFGAPYLHVHRADLHGVLATAARNAGVEIEMGVLVDGYEGDAVITQAGARRADLIVGADGARSMVRARMYPGSAPRFTGQVAWRALVPANAILPGTVPPEATSWTGPGGHVVTYPLRGGALINVVAVRERAGWAAEDWSQSGDPAELRAAFAGWDARIEAVLSAVTACHLWGLFDHAPLPRWSHGPVTLLGDAAHPMLPFMAQGAGMAVEDAWALADRMSRAPDVASGLAGYEAARRPRTLRVHAMSRANAGLFHRRGLGPLKLAVGAALPALAAKQAARVYGYDVTAG